MNPLTSISQLSFVSQQGLKAVNALKLADGELVMGRILKFLPNQYALVQIGSETLTAKLETSVEALKSYWFQAVVTSQGLTLKVVSKQEKEKKALHEQLLSYNRLPITKISTLFVKKLIKEQIPFTSGQLKESVQWLQNNVNEMNVTFIEQSIDTILLILKRKWPVSDGIIQTLLASKQPTLTNKLVELSNLLKGENHLSQTSQQLDHRLQIFLNNREKENFSPLQYVQKMDQATSQKELPQFFKQMILLLGLSYENLVKKGSYEAVQKAALESLKPLLIKGGNEEKHPVLRAKMREVLYQLNAQTLLSMDQGPIQHLFLQFPLALEKIVTEWTLQFYGKKQKNGMIDPNYCRIVFDLHLQHLQELLIDLYIQNKVVKINMYNNYLSKKEVHPFISTLQDALKNLGFQLSSVSVEKMNREVVNDRFQQMMKHEVYEKVDVKI
ncbi:hypothetical protein [Bacillus sp. FJAT-47783]|uniref:hypothetical protein n=1 Tax=Bacillus sp. FJAT-47783 TaxID=2922712 RepID=UPI001FAB40B9|nr:hypothetical protein [Bacillus sp. FJAT-47783]